MTNPSEFTDDHPMDDHPTDPSLLDGFDEVNQEAVPVTEAAGAAHADSTPVEGAGLSPLRSGLRFLRELFLLLLTAMVMAIIMKTFLVQSFFIPTGSMLETLQLQDRVMVEKVSYVLGDPERGDVIVFRRPDLKPDGYSVTAAFRSFAESLHLLPGEGDRDLIKRIIGLPGDEVMIRDGITYINGQALPESYMVPDGGSYGPFVVPDGEYFMMGDNRPNSLDSRFTLGTVPRSHIIGKAFVIIWPMEHARWGLSANDEYGDLG